MRLDTAVYALAADLLEHRGLLRTTGTECGIWYAHQLGVTDPRRKKGRTSTVGAVASACVRLDRIADEVAHLRHLGEFAGVKLVALVEDGRKQHEVVELLRECAARLSDLTPVMGTSPALAS